MDKTRKKRIKHYIAWGCLVVLVAVLAVMPLVAADSAEDEGPVASVMTGTAELGSLTSTINGGGTLTEDAAVEITIPSGVKLTEFLVENGDTVSQGDALAAVDRISVMTAIAQVQDTLDYLDEEIEAAGDEAGATQVRSQTDGRVKLVYAQAGDNVQDVMLEYGALAVLSLDGRMAVDIAADTDLAVGDNVLVAVGEADAVTGRVESTLGNNLIITVADEGYAVEENARVSTTDGTYLGYGKLYIHNPWKATAYYGTVSKVHVEENDTVSSGKTLFTLEDTEHSTAYELLVKQRQEYEEVMLELFKMYQAEAVTAPCDGIVSGVDTDSAYLLSAEGRGWTITLLSNSPTGQDQTYNYFGQVTANDGSLSLRVDYSTYLSEVDYSLAGGLTFDTASMTTETTASIPVFRWNGSDWEQVSAAAGDILLLASADGSSFVFGVKVGTASLPEDSEPVDPPEPETPTLPEESVDPETPSEEPETPGESEKPSEETESSDSADSTLPSGEGQMPGGSGMSGMGGGSGSAVIEPSFEPYDLTDYTILTVTPADAMTLDITVDELDIGKIQVGQTARITVSALGEETIEGTVTEIGTAENSGGNSKFTVTITMARGENMLAGMSACASIPLETVEDVLILPVAAVKDDGSQTFVYTGYDEKNGTLKDPVAVTLGVSDGEHVQILSGLSEGDTCRYLYYEAEETP